MPTKPKGPGGGTGGENTHPPGKPSQTHGNVDAGKGVTSAHEAISQAAQAGRSGTGDQGTTNHPTTTTTSQSAHTQPSGPANPNAVPGGTPTDTTIGTPKQQEGHRLENKAAVILAQAGYNISQNTGAKGRNGTSNPDYDMEGRLWDHYAPSTDNRESIRSELRDKVKHQSESIVINMERSPMTVEQMKEILPNVKELGEVKIIDRNGNIIDAFPQ